MFRDLRSQQRSQESPMDWEWQTQGPTDPQSPFPQFKPQAGQKASFESPQRPSSFVTASSTPAPQFRNPSFTTPRKPFEQELLSEVSGAEDSPADTADENDTPDQPNNNQRMTVFGSGTMKQPLFGKYGAGFTGNSPGRIEKRRGKFANTIVNKVRKRKRLDRDYALVQGQRDVSDSEFEGDAPSRSRKQKLPKEPGYWASLFNYIESHPNLPNVLSTYAQFAVNFVIAGLTIYGLCTFWQTVRSDVDKASDNERALVLTELAACAKDFVDNGCGSDRRVPALKAVCENWEACMQRDPNTVGRARVSASTFAQIFNSFIEPISYKAMIFIVLMFAVCAGINNFAFNSFRSKSHIAQPHPYYAAPPQNFQWGALPQGQFEPQTPQRSVGYDGYNGQGYQSIMPTGTPGQRSRSRSPSKQNRSPSKGDRY